jgi:hypothetical protein
MKRLYFLYIHFWGIFVAQLVLASDLWENGEALLMLLELLAPLVVVAFISYRHSILCNTRESHPIRCWLIVPN